jgi:DNA-binding NarL/FixJ family response regulator
MHTMALDQSALLELLDALKAADAGEVVRHALESVFQALIDAEATAVVGAEPHQRTPARVNWRNGYRDRLLATAAGDLELRIPKLRAGSFFPSLLERRRRIDQALFAVVMEAYVTGTSTRKVDDLVVALGADSGISKSEVSRICADLDTEVAAFRDRPLAGAAFPYVFLDATFCKARVGGDRRGRGSRVAAQAVVIATGISAGGGCRIIILTTFDLDQCVYAALTAGASGFLLKDVSPEQLVDAVRTVRSGNALLAPSITRRLVERFASAPSAPPVMHGDLSELTPRELEVLQLLARGPQQCRACRGAGAELGHRQDLRGTDPAKARAPRPGPGRRPRLPDGLAATHTSTGH